MLRANEKLVLALPKGRILAEVMPVVRRAGIEPESAFDDDDDRRLRFTTNLPEVDIIRVRSFDVATFVAFGGAHLGVSGNDVLMEFDYTEIYAPVDLGVGKCRLVVAEPEEMVGGDDPTTWSTLRVATKYLNLTRRFFSANGLNDYRIVESLGATEGTPAAGTAELIVDITSTGATLKANGLKVLEDGVILHSQANLVASKVAAWPAETKRARDAMLDRLGLAGQARF